jgi:hypothetical protein
MQCVIASACFVKHLIKRFANCERGDPSGFIPARVCRQINAA